MTTPAAVASSAPAGVDALVPLGALAQSITSDEVIDALVGTGTRIGGFAVLAAGTAALAATVFRWYSRQEIPEGVGVLIGLSTVAIWLNTRSALGDAIIGRSDPLDDPVAAVLTVVTFVVGAISADVGRRAGDRLSREAFATAAAPTSIDDVAQLVRSAGRVRTVELPETVDDVDGYDPVPANAKAELAGKTLVFPRGLSPDGLRTRLIDRIERDYGIGHVDLELAADGTVEYLAVGSRLSGIGPTLAPGSVALAIRGDPAPDASPGDVVEVWRRPDADADPERIGRAELRATTGDVATLAIEADEADELADERPVRLVTLPGSPDVARELVSILRAADETVSVATIEPDDPLAGSPVGTLSVSALVLERAGETVPFPGDDTLLEPGDRLYVVGLPEELRRFSERVTLAIDDER